MPLFPDMAGRHTREANESTHLPAVCHMARHGRLVAGKPCRLIWLPRLFCWLAALERMLDTPTGLSTPHFTESARPALLWCGGKQEGSHAAVERSANIMGALAILVVIADSAGADVSKAQLVT